LKYIKSDALSFFILSTIIVNIIFLVIAMFGSFSENILFFSGSNSYQFGDFYDLLYHINDKESLIKSYGNAWNSPLIYSIMSFFMIDLNFSLNKFLLINNNLYLFFIFFGISIILTLFILYKFLEKYDLDNSLKYLIIISYLTSYPFLFAFDRGNTILFVTPIFYIFMYFYLHKKNNIIYSSFLLGLLFNLKYYLCAYAFSLLRGTKNRVILISSILIALFVFILSNFYILRDWNFIQSFLEIFTQLLDYGSHSRNEKTNWNVSHTSLYQLISQFYFWDIRPRFENYTLSKLHYMKFITYYYSLFFVLLTFYMFIKICLTKNIENYKKIIFFLLFFLLASPYSPYYFLCLLFFPIIYYLNKNRYDYFVAILSIFIFTGLRYLTHYYFEFKNDKLEAISFDPAIKTLSLVFLYIYFYKKFREEIL